MDSTCILILNKVGISIKEIDDLDNLMIERDILLSDTKYNEIHFLIPELKKKFSSSKLTSLHKVASQNQKWPLLNLIRQILSVYQIEMIPIRKANGYSKTGQKLYKRLFQLKKKERNDLKEK